MLPSAELILYLLLIYCYCGILAGNYRQKSENKMHATHDE